MKIFLAQSVIIISLLFHSCSFQKSGQYIVHEIGCFSKYELGSLNDEREHANRFEFAQFGRMLNPCMDSDLKDIRPLLLNRVFHIDFHKDYVMLIDLSSGSKMVLSKDVSREDGNWAFRNKIKIGTEEYEAELVTVKRTMVILNLTIEKSEYHTLPFHCLMSIL